jgi:hypothetical protein
MDRSDLQEALEAAVDEAFARYGTSALWSKRRPPDVGPGVGHAIWPTLLREGPLAARPLAVRIRKLSDALDEAAAADGHAPRRAS